MEIERLGFEELIASLGTGCEYLELNRDLLDNLNVFPVPDGDTGINMVCTFKPAVEELRNACCASLEEVSEVMSAALMRNSRGNSGFILAQFFKGFWDEAGGCQYVGADALKRGFERGSFSAVRSLLSPVEGTMTTIIASMAEAMKRLDSRNIASLLEAAIEAGGRSLYRTPDLLPLLAEAGVVDAGALGFIFIVKGMLHAILKKKVEAENEKDFRLEPVSRGPSNRSPKAVYRYCLELEIESDRALNEDFNAFLLRFGDSVALIADGRKVRVHIHTNQPDELLEEAGGYGTVIQSKLDDMEEQIIWARSAAGDAGRAAHQDSVPVLSIIPGPGFRSLFEELGASDCLEYSETLPAADDVLDKINRMRGEDVIVLPNNPNIIPTARLIADQAERHVHILRTESVVDGMAAMYGYSESDSVKVNMNNMKNCIGLALTLRVYRSSRDTRFGRFRVRKGHYFVVHGDELVSTERSLEDSVAAAVKRMEVAGKSHMSFYCGDGFDASRLKRIRQRVSELNSAWEFEEHYGGQRKGVLIISIE